MAWCVRCGAQNPDYVAYCGKCGGELTKDESAVPSKALSQQPTAVQAETGAVPPATPPITQAPRKNCAYCGREVNASSYICPYCGKNPWGPWGRSGKDEALYHEYASEEAPSTNKASGALTLGGIFALLAGVLALGQGLLYLVVGQAIGSYAPSGFLCLCGGLDALFGILSIGAGVFALQRRNFMIAVIGAVCGMLGLGLLIGFLFGLIALILIAISKEEFMD